jgi:Flp pilus assembly protein TadG
MLMSLSLTSMWRDRRGVAAIEFAFIAPIMVLMYFGLAELTTALMAERRASHAASAVGDVVAQAPTIKASEVNDIFTLGEEIMRPFPESSLATCIASIRANGAGVTTVDWVRSKNGPTECPAQGANVALPAGLVLPNQGIVFAKVDYQFESPIGQIIQAPITFKSKFYLRPRKADYVALDAAN